MSFEAVIKQLQELTTQPKQNFAVPMDFFFSNIAENRQAIEVSTQCTKNIDLYQTVLSQVAQAQGDGVTIQHIHARRLESSALVHGMVSLSNGKIAAFYFFDDVFMGLAVTSCFQSGDTNYYRLRAAIVTEPSVLAH